MQCYIIKAPLSFGMSETYFTEVVYRSLLRWFFTGISFNWNSYLVFDYQSMRNFRFLIKYLDSFFFWPKAPLLVCLSEQLNLIVVVDFFHSFCRDLKNVGIISFKNIMLFAVWIDEICHCHINIFKFTEAFKKTWKFVKFSVYEEPSIFSNIYCLVYSIKYFNAKGCEVIGFYIILTIL